MILRLLIEIFVLVYSINSSLSAEVHWNYGEYGPDLWDEFNGTCGGSTQSPINIKTACTVYNSFPSFQFSSNYNVTQDFIVTNDGHTIRAIQLNATAYPMTYSGGGLNGTFQFTNFHLHWGENYKTGSEHQINGKKYAGEIHFVHINMETNKYGVLGVFIDSNKSLHSNNSESNHVKKRRQINKRQVNNPSNVTEVNTWDNYASIIGRLNYTNASVVLRFKLSSLMTTDFSRFFRYIGSTTVPPCIEDSTWTVFQSPIYFTDDTLEVFRLNLYPENFRPVQVLNGRTVFRSFLDNIVSTISDYSCCGENSGKSSGESSALLLNGQLLVVTYFFSFIFYIFSIL